MSDIELVIKMPEETYKHIKNDNVYYLEDGEELYTIVKNGIALPKGHGRLIDADALEKKMCDREEKLGDDRAMWESSAVSVALDMFAPTVVETDYVGLEERQLGVPNVPDPVYTTGIYDDYDAPKTVSMTKVNDIQF